jgi:DNA-binding response OmpR family regulator
MRAIKAQHDPPAVLALSLHDNAEYRYHACEAGADGYVVKSELERAVSQFREVAARGARRVGRSCLGCTVPSRDELAKLALQRSEERLRLALEAGDMGIFDWDLCRRDHLVAGARPPVRPAAGMLRRKLRRFHALRASG